MRSWHKRSVEIAYLLNPAFCGRLLYATILHYQKEKGEDMPFPLVFLVLPLVLHKETRLSINSRTQLLVWVKRHPELMVSYPQRAKSLVTITNEAVEFLLQSNAITITNSGHLSPNIIRGMKSTTKFADEEVTECLKKCEHIARWFARAGKTATIYAALGVRP